MKKVVVIGAGVMGNGIAHVCGISGFDTILVDVDGEQLSRAVSRIQGNLQKGVDKGKIKQSAMDTTLANISTSTDTGPSCEGADLVIEAVPEDMGLKLKIFERLDAACPARTILASNTSSMSVTALGAGTHRPDRVVGIHFFNPVHIMKLLEVVRTLGTSEETLEKVVKFGRQLGKETILVNDRPGFATSRLGVILGCEAIRMLEQGVASVEDIDKAMELGYKHPMGPLRLTDLVGLDTRLKILDHLHCELGEQFRPPSLLRQMVRAGKLGRKTGEGFYRYTSK